MNGICKLCKTPSVLEKSHFIPKVIGKWLKKTSITISGQIELKD